MLDRIVADRTQAQGILHRAVKSLEFEALQKPQDLHVFPLAGLAHARLQETAQGRERIGQFPASQWRCLVQGADLVLQQSQVVDRIEDHILPVVGTGMAGNDLCAATDNHLMDIATDPDFVMAVGDGHRVVVALVAHQGQRVDPRAQLVAGIERRRRQRHQRRVVTDKPLADALAVAAQDIALPVAALFLQVSVEGVSAREPGTRRHEVPPGKA